MRVGAFACACACVVRVSNHRGTRMPVTVIPHRAGPYLGAANHGALTAITGTPAVTVPAERRRVQFRVRVNRATDASDGQNHSGSVQVAGPGRDAVAVTPSRARP